MWRLGGERGGRARRGGGERRREGGRERGGRGREMERRRKGKKETDRQKREGEEIEKRERDEGDIQCIRNKLRTIYELGRRIIEYICLLSTWYYKFKKGILIH